MHQTSHTAPALLLFLPFCFFLASCLDLDVVFCRHGIYATKLLRAKYDVAVRNVSDIVDFLSTGDRKRIASIASPALNSNLGTCTLDDTSAWCDLPDACSGNFGQQYPLEAIETTRLLHGIYVDESSACYV